jgi:hypothetical protein
MLTDYAIIEIQGQAVFVRCPGDTIHFMRFGYQVYVDRLVELAGIRPVEEWEPYESWDPYRLQDPSGSQS